MGRKAKVVRTIHIGLHEPESVTVSKIEDAGSSVTEIVRQLLREYGDKHFPEDPAYAQAAKMRAEIKKKQVEAAETFERMSPEDYVTNVLRGKVRDGKAWFRIANGREIPMDLGNIKTVTKENNDLVSIHNEILDRTLKYPGGLKEYTDADFDKMLKGWYEEDAE